ncbi:hypothetical protein AAXB25_34800, partial [Paenibacillus lautus]|uniref:hypothetical protein n=1 Tax=Paenibacillus lautus TaxID=1401 RepID=UPI003D28979C
YQEGGQPAEADLTDGGPAAACQPEQLRADPDGIPGRWPAGGGRSNRWRPCSCIQSRRALCESRRATRELASRRKTM